MCWIVTGERPCHPGRLYPDRRHADRCRPGRRCTGRRGCRAVVDARHASAERVVDDSKQQGLVRLARVADRGEPVLLVVFVRLPAGIGRAALGVAGSRRERIERPVAGQPLTRGARLRVLSRSAAPVPPSPHVKGVVVYEAHRVQRAATDYIRGKSAEWWGHQKRSWRRRRPVWRGAGGSTPTDAAWLSTTGRSANTASTCRLASAWLQIGLG